MDVAEHLFGRHSARVAPVLRKIVVVIPAHDEADRLPDVDVPWTPVRRAEPSPTWRFG